MDISAIQQKIEGYRLQGKSIFSTCSFQTHSVVLVHVLRRIDKSIPIYFINTGFHFAETILYKDRVADAFGIRIHDLFSNVPKNMQKNASGNLLFTFDPDYCCYLNKVQPVENLLERYDVWISGGRADQNSNRRNLKEEQKTNHHTIRYHPLLGWTQSDIRNYIAAYNLPEHPLDARGYTSIGCEPCTRPAGAKGPREGRWFGMTKTECGLHTDLMGKNKT